MRCASRLLAGTGLLRVSPLLHSGIDDFASIPQLRSRLRQQRSMGVDRMASIDTESRLVIELSRSSRPEERQEALEMAEKLWCELGDMSVAIMTPTRTAMRVNLCSAMRRCALISRDREAADLWTARFAERAARLSPTDFIQTEEHQAAWRAPRESAASRVRPGTGITEEDIEADDREELERASHEEQGGPGAAPKVKQKKISPMQEYRHQVFLDHPSFEYAFHRGRPKSPGPRYTG